MLPVALFDSVVVPRAGVEPAPPFGERILSLPNVVPLSSVQFLAAGDQVLSRIERAAWADGAPMYGTGPRIVAKGSLRVRTRPASLLHEFHAPVLRTPFLASIVGNRPLLAEADCRQAFRIDATFHDSGHDAPGARI